MKVTKHRRSRFHRRAWLSFGLKGGKAAPREYKWYRRMRNWNGIAFNFKESSYWFEFRNHA